MWWSRHPEMLAAIVTATAGRNHVLLNSFNPERLKLKWVIIGERREEGEEEEEEEYMLHHMILEACIGGRGEGGLCLRRHDNRRAFIFLFALQEKSGWWIRDELTHRCSMTNSFFLLHRLLTRLFLVFISSLSLSLSLLISPPPRRFFPPSPFSPPPPRPLLLLHFYFQLVTTFSFMCAHCYSNWTFPSLGGLALLMDWFPLVPFSLLIRFSYIFLQMYSL